MRILRSKNASINTSSISDVSVTKSLATVTKKKNKTRGTKLSISKDSITESSENENIIGETKKSNEFSEGIIKLKKKNDKKIKKLKHLSNNKLSVSKQSINESSDNENIDESQSSESFTKKQEKKKKKNTKKMKHVNDNKHSFSKESVYESSGKENGIDESQKSFDLTEDNIKHIKNKNRKRRKQKNSANLSTSTTSDVLTTEDESVGEKLTKNDSSKGAAIFNTSRNSINTSKNDTYDDNINNSTGSTIKNVSRLSDTQKFINLAKDENKRFSVSLDSEKLPKGLLKLNNSSSGESVNKTITNEQDCIIIDDSFDTSKKDTNIIYEKDNDTFGKINTTFDKINLTFEKKEFTLEKTNVTFEKISTTFTESCSEETSRRDTFVLDNCSGQWSVEDVSEEILSENEDRVTLHKKQKKPEFKINNQTFGTPSSTNRKSEILNINEDRVTLHKKQKVPELKMDNKSFGTPSIAYRTNENENRIRLHKNKKTPEYKINNETFGTPSNTNRKKWVKFESAPITESPILKTSKFYETNGTKILCSSTPFERRYPVTPARLNKSVQSPNMRNKSLNLINSVTKSNTKSAIKAKAMPNFALIHKKANEKIESIKDYSERKRERAKQLLSGEKPEGDKENHKNHVVKSSQDLFGNVQTNKTVIKTPKIKSIVKSKNFISKLPQFKVKAKLELSSLKTDQTLNKSKITMSLNKSQRKKSISNTTVKPVSESKGTSLNKSKTEKSTINNTVKPVSGFSDHNLKTNKYITEKYIPKKTVEKPVPVYPKSNFTVNKSIVVKPVPKTTEKPLSVFSKGNYMAHANKTNIKEKLANRDNRRDQIKGVRSNRRFDLLMQMRNNS